MGDFLLDFRPHPYRRLRRAAEALRFAPNTRTVEIDGDAFGLLLTYTGNPELWAPLTTADGSVIAVAGRVVFDEAEWKAAEAVEGTGGLAAKALARTLQNLGSAALEQINGNATVIVHDAPHGLVHIVTDAAGVFPAFEVETADGWLFCSHPDVLASMANESHRLDETSLAEFILSGTVTPPFSYYERVRAADSATVYTIDLSHPRGQAPRKRRHFDLSYRGDPPVDEEDIAAELAAAIRRAVERRTLPRLGAAAVALSGGMDSRVVLACSLDKQRTLAFSCFDEPNLEFRAAEAVARSLSVRFVPMKREADYYAEHAEAGVRISGGMGSFANNHFFGVNRRLHEEGAESLLTGCYCDYLFKGLPLNRERHWLTRRETLGGFRHQFYFDHHRASTTLGARAWERVESRVPLAYRAQHTPSAVFEIETRRTFPLSYEGDNQQRVVPQRIIGWSPPFADREVLDVYCRLPYHYKLNRSLFRRSALTLAPDTASVLDANTGARLDASPVSEWIRRGELGLLRRLRHFSRSHAEEGSWPNWPRYLATSRKVADLWARNTPGAFDLFRRVLGPTAVPQDVAALTREQPFLFAGLLTLKLWLDQRSSCSS